MSRIVLARHGQTAWNALGRLQGHTDIPLDETGRDQARALAAKLGKAGIASVWASDLGRAQETAAIAAEMLGLAAPRVDPELRERKFGVFEGLTRDQIAVAHPEAWRAWQQQTAAPPGGEPREEAIARLGRALARIAREPGPALVVSHGGVIRLWLTDLRGEQAPMIGNGAVFHLAHDGARFSELRG
ncbi:MAG TPA: histidine phosphatase family protein [Kofleriaceae bacterium]|jgi:probable phosphoglycerate mutase